MSYWNGRPKVPARPQSVNDRHDAEFSIEAHDGGSSMEPAISGSAIACRF